MAEQVGMTIVRRDAAARWECDVDLCVVGAGISGVTCAITAARLGLRVLLADACPWVGGQAVGVPIGTIAGLFSCGPAESQGLLTPLLATELLEALHDREASWPLYSRRARTTIIVYDEAELERIFEQMLAACHVVLLLGAVADVVQRDGARITRVRFATRFGTCDVQAPFFIDASGDAALTWLAGAACRVSTKPIYGTQMAVVGPVAFPSGENPADVARRAEELLREHGSRYGITREECRVFPLPPRGLAVLNATHLRTPLDPLAFWQEARAARGEVERALELLRREYPAVFGEARARRLGLPGIRQTRTIMGRTMVTLADVQAGRHFPDAIARAAWPVELHDSQAHYQWQPLPDGHWYTIPYRALLPAELDNVLAIGRCIDADPLALSSARVMGPCVGMGVAAAHAVSLAHTSDCRLPAIDVASLQMHLAPNLEGIYPCE